jgi:hypothetical protein
LRARGYACPAFQASPAGIPLGADAATFCGAKGCTIRIRPEALRGPHAHARALGTSRPQWRNLLLHEAVHFIDIQHRGRSDHGPEFRSLARGFGVTYVDR